MAWPCHEFIQYGQGKALGRGLVDRLDGRHQRAKGHHQEGIVLQCGDPILPQQALGVIILFLVYLDSPHAWLDDSWTSWSVA